MPEWMLGAPGSDPDQPVRVVDLFALLLCVLITFILTRGVRSAARVETALSGSRAVLSSSSSRSACST